MQEAVAGEDVARPGTTPALATSKPVIVGHTSQVADPMVSAPLAGAPAAGSGKPKLAPSAQMAASQAAADVKTSATTEELGGTGEVEDSQARVQELIDSREYNVSIAGKQRKGGARSFVVTLGVVVVVGVVALFVLSDLKIIDLGIKLPFHIFKQ